MANFPGSGWTFEWKIKNLSYSSLKKGKSIVARVAFCASMPTHSSWTLVLYPRGIVDEDHVGVYLRRDKRDLGPKIIEVSFQFAFLDKNGSLLNVRTGSKRDFAEGSMSGMEEFITQDIIFGPEREKFLPDDILIVQCTIWIKDEPPFKIKLRSIPVQTIFEINRRSFFWRVGGFSFLRPGQMNNFLIVNGSQTVLLRFVIVSGFDRDIKLKITSWDESIKTFSFKISVIDSEGINITFGSNKMFAFDCKERCILLLSREQLMQNKSRYLPNDVLSLACEYAFSTGTILHMYERNTFGTISPDVPKEVIENVKEQVISDQNVLHQAHTLVDDIKSMYSDAVLCDIELRTSTQTFPAHKNILGARSSVFRRMFSNDMKENNSGHVDIIDLEDDTVHRMLLYIYTDFLDLQFESASKLYSAAEKYAIFSLKEKCSRFLKDNISPTKACDLLTLADKHQDDDLKRVVQDYILAYDKEVFGSLEWKDFMVTNLQLAADIMYRKVYPNSD